MHGILVKNDSGHILISSEVTALHFLGKAKYDSLRLSGLSNFPSYTGDDDKTSLSGRCVHRYRINYEDTPLFFIKPVDYTKFYGILQQNKYWDFLYKVFYWEVDIIQSGPNSVPPDIYAFASPKNVPASTDTVGIQARNAKNEVTFDSRLKPLAIYAAHSMQPPVLPCDGGHPVNQSGFAWNEKTLDFNFKSDSTFSYQNLAGTVPITDLMFAAPSVAQAVYTRQKKGSKRSSPYMGGPQWHHSTAVWWAMYHQAYRLSAGQVHAGWAVYAADYWFSSTWENPGWLEGGGGGGSIQSGTRPFNDLTINLSANTLILVDSTLYI